MKGFFLNYDIFVEGVLVSIERVEKKEYKDKISEPKTVLSFVRVLDNGKLETLKVKAPYAINYKKGDKVKLPVRLSAMDGNIYYSLVI